MFSRSSISSINWSFKSTVLYPSIPILFVGCSAKVPLYCRQILPAKVMLHCGSTLALSSKMPSLNVKELSACTPAVWTKCRKQLKAKLEEKLGDAT